MSILKRNPNRIKLRKAELAYQVAIIVIMAIIVLICIFPFIYVIGMSLTSQGEMIEKNFFVIFPEKPILRSYKMVLGQSNFINSFGVSIARTVLGVVAALILTIPGGYILAQKNLPGKKWFMYFFILTMILGGGLIPGYLLIKNLHLLNTFWVYIIPSMGGAFNLLIVKLFVEGIPDEIIESADLDGATELQKLKYIAIPLLVPTICALSLFAAVGQWNSWFDAMLYVQNAKIQPLSLMVRNLLVSVSITETSSGSMTLFDQMAPESMKMATVVIAVLPILCVYPFIQKYFIYGVYTGAVKG